jgi:hypothetical protein
MHANTHAKTKLHDVDLSTLRTATGEDLSTSRNSIVSLRTILYHVPPLTVIQLKNVFQIFL